MGRNPAHGGDVGTRVILENDAVRVWEMELEPGESCEFHQHHHDHLILYPGAATMRGQRPGDDRWTIEQDVEPGFAMYRTVGAAGVLEPHRLSNAGAETVVHYVVELLGSSARADAISQDNGRGRLKYADR